MQARRIPITGIYVVHWKRINIQSKSINSHCRNPFCKFLYIILFFRALVNTALRVLEVFFFFPEYFYYSHNNKKSAEQL